MKGFSCFLKVNWQGLLQNVYGSLGKESVKNRFRVFCLSSCVDSGIIC